MLGGRAAETSLVVMPTGTGKSGVIAGAIYRARTSGHYLVAAPWVGIVDQLHDALDVGVWSALGVDRPAGFPQVRYLPKTSEIDSIRSIRQPTIFVSTVAKLVSIHRELQSDPKRRRLVFDGFAGLFVDEGHYEPAKKWSQAIRAFDLPTVLLTATPYRNDALYFNVEEKNRHRLSHADAVATGLLREPTFQVLSSADVDRFTDDLVSFANRTLPSESRVIIRCADAKTIRHCVAALQRLGESAIGLHETYKVGAGAALQSKIPNTKSADVKYWVHQNKLIEGIDDPRFRCLAILDGFGNDRATIQQIGRVLRNPQRSTSDQTAWVLDRTGDTARAWQNYREFDASSIANSDTLATMASVLLTSQPANAYLDNRYRKPLNLDAADLAAHVQFPLATRVYQLPLEQAKPTLQEWAERVIEEWTATDRIVASDPEIDQIAFIPYVSARNSPLLLDTTFIEPEFGYTVIWTSESRLFIHDTLGRTPDCIRDNLRPEARAKLSKLMSTGSRMTSVSLDNTDVNQNAIRSRSMRAAALEEIAAGLTDYAYVCTIAEGYPDNDTRRYLGLSRARVRDHTSMTTGTLADYEDWLRRLDDALDSTAEMTRTLDRFAQVAPLPPSPRARHILLDVDSARFKTTNGGSAKGLRLDDYASPVTADHFEVVVNGKKFKATIKWIASREQYELDSTDLEQEGYRHDETDHNLIDFLNAEQAFRVVPESKDTLYASGTFVSLQPPGTSGRPFPLLDILTPVAELGVAAAKHEKGYFTASDGWSPGCVFEIIDRLAPTGVPAPTEISAHFPNLSTLLCGDMGREVADFIAVQPGRVAFIHAKAGNSALSASAFHEITSQAIKNILWMQPNMSERPDYDWTSPWNASIRETATATKKLKASKATRLRLGPGGTSDERWDQVADELSSPTTDREVWLVVGNTLSKAKLERIVAGRKTPTPQFIQIYSLLQSAWSTASQAGVKLRVFCST